MPGAMLGDRDPSPEEIAQAAKLAHERRDWEAALKLWDLCLSSDPEARAAADWRNFRAMTLMELGRHDEAERAYGSLAQDFPMKPAAFVGLARLARLQRNWPEACQRWAKCVERFPAHSNAVSWRCSLASALTASGRYAEADDVYRALDSEQPDLSVGLVGLALNFHAQKDWAKALDHWNLLFERFPQESSAPYLSKRAMALERLESWSEAHESWDAIIAKFGPNRDRLFARARCYVRSKGPADEVESVVVQLLETFPDDVPILNLHASIAMSRNDGRVAFQRFQRCIDLEPDNVNHYQSAMAAAVQAEDEQLCERLIAGAPASLVNTREFEFRVLLTRHRFGTNFEQAFKIVNGIDNLDQLDLQSARSIGQFLSVAQEYPRLIAFTQSMIARFPTDLFLIGLKLKAVYLDQSHEAFSSEKRDVLASLSSRDALKLLRGLPPNWLTTAEAKALIDHAFTEKEKGNLDMQRVMTIGFRGDTEILEYLAGRIESSGCDASTRFMAQSSLATVNDRRKLAYANLEPQSWETFHESSRAIATEFAAFLDGLPHDSSMSELHDAASILSNISAATKSAWTFSAESYYDAAHFAAWIEDRIRRRQPTSVLRLGDGEGHFLPYAASVSHLQEADQRAIQQLWWGGTRITMDAAIEMTTQFAASVARADAIGVPPPRRLILDLYKHRVGRPTRGLVSVLDFLHELTPTELQDKVMTSCHIHTDLDSWDLYGRIFASVSSVSVISCHNLAVALSDRFGISIRVWLPVPAEHRYAQMFVRDGVPTKEPFYPELFERYMNSVAPLPGEVFLVAAGFLGKLLCDRIRARGGIAFDIGSVADLWMGYATRRGSINRFSFDLASSLIYGHPFPVPFYAKPLSPDGPCRSDSTRRRNLLPEFEGLFQTDDQKYENSDFMLRIVGHPRCGSRYTTEVFRRLGVNIGHEIPREHGLCSWIHTVDDQNPPFNSPYVPGRLFRTTLAYVRNPLDAIPSIMLENCVDASFSFRRFQIARLLGVDVAKRHSAFERAVECYVRWMQIVEDQQPLLTVRVEYLLDDLSGNLAALSSAGVTFDWTRRASAMDVRHDVNSGTNKHIVPKPTIKPHQYQQLSPDLLDALSKLCARYGYPLPGV